MDRFQRIHDAENGTILCFFAIFRSMENPEIENGSICWPIIDDHAGNKNVPPLIMPLLRITL